MSGKGMSGRKAWVWIVALLLIGCGGGDESATTSDTESEGGDPVEVIWPVMSAAPIEKQTHMTESVMDGLEGCIGDSRLELNTMGYSVFAAGGLTSAGDVEVWWAVHLPGADAISITGEGVALQTCEAGVCACHVVTPKTAVTFADLDLPVVGAPVLAKTLQPTADDGSTALAEISAALVDEASAPLDMDRYRGKRRLVIANAYGPVFDVDFGGFVSLMEASGLFTEVIGHDYVTAADMDTYLEELHNQDVLIWFGAAVRRVKGPGKFKPEGMTVNRAIYGDETYSYERIEARLKGAPLGGPGLIVLMGGESYGTTLEGMAPYLSTENLINSLLVRPRTLIGFEGVVSAVNALTGLRAFMEEAVAQTDFASAIEAFNGPLSGATIRSNQSETVLAGQTLDPGIGGFWGDASPSTGEFVGELLIGANTECTPVGGGVPQNPIEHAVEFFADISVEGPFFWGEKQLDGIDFELFGVLGNLKQGGDVRFWISGSHVGHQDLVVLGDGVFCEAGDCSGSVTGINDFNPGGKLFFQGTAETTTYTDDTGATCRPSGVFLTQKGGKPGWIIVDP